MTPIEQARLRMPPALPMSMAPRDGTPVLVCGVADYEIGESDDKPVWIVACRHSSGIYCAETTDQYLVYIHAPLGWLPLPEVLTAPVAEMPTAPPTPEAPK